MAPRRTTIATLGVVAALLGGGCAPSGQSDGATSPAMSAPGEAAPERSAPPSAAPGAMASERSAPPCAAADVAGADRGDDEADQPEGATGHAGGPQELQRLVDLAVRDLAGRRGVAAVDITVVLSELIVWPDTSIGCPLRDRRYVDEPQRGTRIHLRVDGVVYRYHTGGRWRDPFLCDPSARAEPPIRRLEP